MRLVKMECNMQDCLACGGILDINHPQTQKECVIQRNKKAGDRWYEENIEEGVRDVVRLLRDHGYNTFCSCHHDMTIDINYFPGIDLMELHNLLWNHLAAHDENVSFDINVRERVEKGATLIADIQVTLIGREKIKRVK